MARPSPFTGKDNWPMTEKDFDEFFNQMPDAHSEHLIREFVAKAVAEEREACARIAEGYRDGQFIAHAIRTRGAECLTPS